MMIWICESLVVWHHSGEGQLKIYGGGRWTLGVIVDVLSLVKEFVSYQYEVCTKQCFPFH